MKYRKYLVERPIIFFLFLWLLFSVETFLLTVNAKGWLFAFVAVNLVLVYFLTTYLEFLRWKKTYEEFREAVNALDEKYLAAELLDKSSHSEQALFREILEDAGKSMTEHVNQYKREMREYKEYIELWIHEIKIPIAAAGMIVENHKSEITKEIAVELKRIEMYTEQALFYARSNEVEKDYLIKNVELTEVVNEVLSANRRELIALNTSIDLHDLEMTVRSDSKWLVFILGQIINNSIKYVSDKPLHLEIYGKAGKEYVKLFVKDNGIGMKTGEVSRAFDKGFTGENGRGRKRATGIGLYLCRKLCLRLRHDITLSSVENAGTLVTLTFPKSSFVEVI